MPGKQKIAVTVLAALAMFCAGGGAAIALRGHAAAPTVFPNAPAQMPGVTVITEQNYPNATPADPAPGMPTNAAAELERAYAATQSPQPTQSSGATVISEQTYPNATPADPAPGMPPNAAAELQRTYAATHSTTTAAIR